MGVECLYIVSLNVSQEENIAKGQATKTKFSGEVEFVQGVETMTPIL